MKSSALRPLILATSILVAVHLVGQTGPKRDQAFVYHAGGKLFLHTLADATTKQVSTDPKADYRYPHGEATPN